MQIIIANDYKELSLKSAQIIKDVIDQKPTAVLGLATGSTPIGLYEELIRFHRNNKLDFSQITTFNLDEYIGIDADHQQSYRFFMNQNLFNHINIDKDKTFVPDGTLDDYSNYGIEYDQLIEKHGGIDIQVLGIGSNGHIAFNEPAPTLPLHTSVVKLTQSTIQDNSRFFANMDEVPKTAISMGIGSIMKAKKVILMASGENKRNIITRLLTNQQVTTQLPASLLKLHRDFTLIVDKEAYGTT